MTPVPRCSRCHRPATNAVAVEGYVITTCSRHAHELAERLADDARVMVGRRQVRLDAPALERGRPC